MRDQLREAIGHCEVCVFLATPRSVESGWCRAELGAFWGNGKRVISFLYGLDERQLPEQLRGDLYTSESGKVLETLKAVLAQAEKRRSQPGPEIKRAVCNVRLNGSVGKGFTGYLVRPRIVLSSDHAVEDIQPQSGASAKFDWVSDRHVFERWKSDNSCGTGMLLLASPLAHVTPARFADDDIRPGTFCRGYGYPRDIGGVGVPFGCEILDVEHEDEHRRRCLVAQSPVFMSGSVRGLSGAPLWSEQGIVGHIHHVLGESESGEAAYGIVLVTPAREIQRAASDWIKRFG